jgi:hypothetical protein
MFEPIIFSAIKKSRGKLEGLVVLPTGAGQAGQTVRLPIAGVQREVGKEYHPHLPGCRVDGVAHDRS